MFADFIKTLLSLNYRESWALDNILLRLDSLIKFAVEPRKILATVAAVLQLFGMLLFDKPIDPIGAPLNLDGYEMVFCDEFNGDSLDMSKWQHRAIGPRRSGFNASSQVRVENGNLIITGEYLENGEYGAGWYTGMVNLVQKYERGYFEIRCICNDCDDLWSAFWIQADHPYDPEYSRGGIGGAELDIFEAMSYGKPGKHNSVTSTVHCSGMQGDTSGGLNSCVLGSFNADDIYHQYNTYGMMWTREEYILYINGVETARTSFADGVSQVPEQVIVSLEMPDEVKLSKDTKGEYKVDYVKIYQIAQ